MGHLCKVSFAHVRPHCKTTINALEQCRRDRVVASKLEIELLKIYNILMADGEFKLAEWLDSEINSAKSIKNVDRKVMKFATIADKIESILTETKEKSNANI